MSEKPGIYATEHDLQTQAIEWLHRCGYLVIRPNSGRAGKVAFIRWYDREHGAGSPNTAGVSDILALSPAGQLVAIECKAREGTLREQQAAFLHAVERRGGLALVVRGVEDLEAAL